MSRTAPDNIKRELFSTRVQPHIAQTLRLAAVKKKDPIYVLVEEALIEYFKKQGITLEKEEKEKKS